MKDFQTYDAKALEAEVLAYWEREKIPSKLAANRKGAKKFFVLDGPPYVNALPHVGHVKTTTVKDLWTRFKHMQGFDTFIQAGFDCHGLPVEVIVEKELGITSKKEIVEKGIAAFDEACLSKVANNEKHWLAYYRRLGAWRAFFEPYFTLKPCYIESGWWTFKQLHEKGFVSEGRRSIHWCPHCETALSGYEVSDSYKTVTDPSVFVKFKVAGAKNEFLLAWTTTPWTLPANVAIAAAAGEKYVKARVKSTGEVLIIGKKLCAKVIEKAGLECEVVGELDGSELDGMRFEPLVDVQSQRAIAGDPAAHRVYLSIPLMVRKKYKKHSKREETGGGVKCRVECSECGERQLKELAGEEAQLEAGIGGVCEKCGGLQLRVVELNAAEKEFEQFVTMAEGTGLVHVAPGHGQTDNHFGKHYGLPALSPVDEAGKFTADVDLWQGKFVKSVDKLIIDYLAGRGSLLFEERVTHAYPLCWRCKSPLIFRLSNQIYLSVEPIKEAMLASNDSVNWMPGYGRDAFANWVAGAADWCISQQRFWGIPIPLWKCGGCGASKVVGSATEMADGMVDPAEASRLKKLLATGELDLHRHTVDGVELGCKACGGVMRRTPDIFSVWFDSGIAPWASFGYPHRKGSRELFESMFPIDMVSESQDQIRGWFYAMFFCSHGVFGKPAFKSVSMMGWVLDEKGEKMSKSLGNVVPAGDALDKLGADCLRLYNCWEIAPWDVQKFSFTTAQEVVRSVNILWNVFKFLETYSPDKLPVGKVSLAVEDKWIISRLNTVSGRVTSHLEAFEFHLAGRALMDFIVNDFSRWYVKLCRDRVSGEDAASRKACLSTMRTVLQESAKLLAPISPFISEYLFLKTGGEGGSVHFCNYPKPDASLVNEPLERSMSIAMLVSEAANSLRQAAKLKLRWPLAELKVAGPAPITEAVALLESLIASQNNVLKASVGGAPAGWPSAKTSFDGVEFTVALDVKRTPHLVLLGRFRELVRAVQASRKKNGFIVQERIALAVRASDVDFEGFLKQNAKLLQREVGASSVKVAQGEAELSGEFAVENEEAGCSAAYARV